ncbi:MAG TPA: hypothetical protein VFS43_38440 [Polyangiaceae bacterium]|nr:hypothetical protein [Polyangiaceae bacterium]
MTRLVDQQLLEPVEPHDINLRQRFGARRADVEARLSRRRKPHLGQAKNGVFAGDESDAQALGAVLGGLEAYFESGFQVRVTPGAMLCAHPGGAGVVPRPGTWSGRSDADDDALGLYELAQDALVTPSPLPASVPSPEWWAVVVTPQLAAVEVDSDRKVFNETTGAFDAASQNKVFHRRLVPSVVRGAGGGDVSTVALPAGAVVVAWVYVHQAGATGLDDALFYDARRLPDPSAPNRVGGRWAARQQALRGELSATLRGEGLSLRSARADEGGDVTFPAVAEPGAAWESGFGPFFAYLYLCRVRGTVPRLRGTGADTDNLEAYTSYEVAGALVLSPKPPAVTPPEPGKGVFDLRNDQTLNLPNPAHNPATLPKVLAIKFGGTAPPGEAICVGVIPYGSVLGGAPAIFDTGPVPTIVACDRDGWCSGVQSGLASVATTATPGAGGAFGTASVTVTVAEASAGKKYPVEGADVQLTFSTTDADMVDVEIEPQRDADLRNLRPVDRTVRQLWAQPGGTTGRASFPARTEFLPAERVTRLEFAIKKTAESFALSASLRGFKLPYNAPLYTPA